MTFDVFDEWSTLIGLAAIVSISTAIILAIATVYPRPKRSKCGFILWEAIADMLGKRAAQIYRLAATPAKLLVVQHSHAIGEAVRATLRAFAVTPSHPRRYCFIDGRDTYRILKAYDLLLATSLLLFAFATTCSYPGQRH